MSTLSSLVSGTDCGPINPLQGLSKRFDSDRGAQQDQFGSGRAGSSREVFRSQEPQVNPALLREAADFFQGSSRDTVVPQGHAPFDLASLNASLNVHPASRVPAATFSPSLTAGWANDMSSQTTAARSSPSVAWAGDFLQQGQNASLSGKVSVISARDTMLMQTPPIQQGPMMRRPQYELAMANLALMQQTQPMRMTGSIPLAPAALTQPAPQASEDFSSWASHFSQVDSHLETTAAPQPEFVVNDLAETAGLLVSALKAEQNEKFKNSAFLGLMRQVRDKEMVVEGNDLVASSSGAAFDIQSIPSSLKGKGVVRDVPILGERRKSVHFEAGSMDTMTENLRNIHLSMAQSKAAGIEVDESTLQQFADASASMARAERQVPNYFRQQEAEWAHMQQDWDLWDATATGLQQSSSSTGQLTEHQFAHRSVLEKEAAAQRDPANASAWLDLGVKQQENEREDNAIEALDRAVELDPTLLPAWLALAISHTNEGNRYEATRAIRQWISHNDQYAGVSAKYNVKDEAFERAAVNVKAMRSELIDCLLDMANTPVGEGLDADVQVALAVLLNTSEDFDRAQDCFRAALEVRPDDWQLYNRVGATLANNGRADEALPFYYRALELNPGYIRARFNLGISCINLHRYEEAASHVLDALILQESDGTASDSSARGVTSSALWDALRTDCVHLQRMDLVALCEKRDLSAFRKEFTNRSEA